ncbi:MAG TPA: zinc ribbon domain-containing protein [Candidatus Angelobacter sp.]|nr:zinc ribbon domain-containing protein [Candidatus Angelobacter sp.]
MRRYSQVFLIIALFCFLFPFTVITPVSNSGVFPMTGWDMLNSQKIAVSKQPPLFLDIPLRVPMLLAVLCGGVSVIVKLAGRKDAAWIAAAVTTVAAISLLTITASSPLVQLTDGQTVLHRFENPGVRLLPAFYISLVLMGAAAVSSLMNLGKQPGQQSAGFAVRPPATFAATASAIQIAAPARPATGVPSNSFCIKCGSGLASAARFCNRCGTSVPALSTITKPADVPKVQEEQRLPVAASVVTSPARTVPAIESAPPAASLPSAATQRAELSSAVAPPSRVTPTSGIMSPVSQRRSTSGAKLGFAAAAVVVATAVWFVFHPTTDNSASVAGPTAVSVYPVTVRVSPGGTVQIQALVTGGTDREVQWSITEGTTGGSIEPAGATVQNGTMLLLANYKAPVQPGIYHVTAVSTANQSRKAVAQVIVEYGVPPRFSLTPRQQRY